MKDKTLFLVGLGDLAKKIIVDLASLPESPKIVVLTRNNQSRHWCEQLKVAHNTDIELVLGDALDTAFVERCFVRHRPTLILQLASRLSPFCFTGTRHEALASQVGFGLQLPAQFPIAWSVCRAARAVVPEAGILNCSFPDVVNPMLNALGCAPDAGFGNAGIIEYLLHEKYPDSEFQVIAHHYHVITILKANCAENVPPPKVYQGGKLLNWESIKPTYETPLSGDQINQKTAASGRSLIQAMLDETIETTASVAGPLGLAGGYPIKVIDQRIELALPPGTTSDALKTYFEQVQCFDGIQSIDTDGTVYFTDQFCRQMHQHDPALCSPLPVSEHADRFEKLTAFMAS